jgi:hypothetical protein
VLAAVATGLLIADMALGLAAGAAPAALRAAEVLDPGEYARIGRRVAAAERSLAKSPPARRRVVIVTGLSTAREDVDGAVVGNRLCGGARVLNLASSGGSYRELAYYLRVLKHTRIRSSLTVVGIHPVWLAGRKHVEVAVAGAPRASGGSLAGRAKRWLWLSGNRRGMHALLQNALVSVRDRLADHFSFSVDARYPGPAGSPWETQTGYEGRHASDADRVAQLRAWTAYGWFDATRFDMRGPEAAALREVVDAARALGGPVVFVLMPEHSELRRRSPVTALASVQGILATAGNPPVLDLRDALDDSSLFDFAHANAVGRATFSTVLPQVVAPHVRCAGAAGAS